MKKKTTRKKFAAKLSPGLEASFTELYRPTPKITKRTRPVFEEGMRQGVEIGKTQGALNERKLMDASQQGKRTESLSHLVDSLARIADAAAHLVGEIGNRI